MFWIALYDCLGHSGQWIRSESADCALRRGMTIWGKGKATMDCNSVRVSHVVVRHAHVPVLVWEESLGWVA